MTCNDRGRVKTQLNLSWLGWGDT